MIKRFAKKRFVVVVFIVFILLFAVFHSTKENREETSLVQNKILSTDTKTNDFPSLDVPSDVFTSDDSYQSYPTTTITLRNYSRDPIPLKIKTLDEIMQELYKSSPEGWGESKVRANYQEYGALSSNYLPENYIGRIDKFDVDGDGMPETIVSYNGVHWADGGSFNSDIIKANKIIFSVREDNSSIVQVDSGNGFYVKWINSKEFPDPRCCIGGFIRTRFISKDEQFVPVYEQIVRYVKTDDEYEP